MIGAVAPAKHIVHLGCGRKQHGVADLFPLIGLNPEGPFKDAHLTHVDADPQLQPDVVCTLGRDRLPLPDDSVDLVVAWHVLEHIGRQGETAEWFAFWEDVYRVLKPGALLYAECPYWSSVWAWADPTHVRGISEHALMFFNQDNYRIPDNMISPYRIACDLRLVGALATMPRGWTILRDPADPQVASIRFTLAAYKPLRPWWRDAAGDRP